MRVVILASLVLIGFTACKKKEIKKIEKSVTEGTWRITRFIDSGDDETSDYATATLTFNNDGTLVLTHGSTYSGTWSVTKDSSSDDDSSDDNDTDFNLSLPVPHESLSDDWDVESYSDTKIVLKDLDDDEPNKSDYLTLEKL
ncbi:MAG: hypothetical protein ACO1N0_15870 [Fluviicola sp.]